MKALRSIYKAMTVIGLSALAAVAQAAPINIAGTIENGTGALAQLLPLGTAFAGVFDWSGTLDGGQVSMGDNMAGFCFTSDATGLPPTSPTCDAALASLPMLRTGQVVYDGNANAPGSTFEQAGTTFDGNAGLLSITTYAPTAQVWILIDLVFNGDGSGALFAEAGSLGSASGCFSYGGGSCEVVPVPAAAWLFGSALIGLAGIKRKK
jgi:hypothetical protein